MAAWAQELNPEVIIEINNALPAVRENAALFMGTDVIGIGIIPMPVGARTAILLNSMQTAS